MKVSLAILAGSALMALTPPASAADYDCSEAHTVSERAICAHALLSRLDDRMARFYGWLWAALADPDRTALRDEQRRFLALRDACGADTSCLKASYLTRIEDLAARLRHITRGATPT